MLAGACPERDFFWFHSILAGMGNGFFLTREDFFARQRDFFLFVWPVFWLFFGGVVVLFGVVFVFVFAKKPLWFFSAVA